MVENNIFYAIGFQAHVFCEKATNHRVADDTFTMIHGWLLMTCQLLMFRAGLAKWLLVSAEAVAKMLPLARTRSRMGRASQVGCLDLWSWCW